MMCAAENNSLIVRPATRADADAIGSLARQLLVFEHSLERSMGELNSWASSPGEILKQMDRHNLRFIVAESGGEVVGYIKVMILGPRLTPSEIGFRRWLIGLIDQSARGLFNLLLRRPRNSIRQTGGYIAGIFVRPDFRRSGVGATLVKSAESWLKDHGIPTCDLHVLSANEEARLFWSARGYHPLSVGLRKPL